MNRFLLVLLVVSLTSGCSLFNKKPTVITTPVLVERSIPVQPRPRPPMLLDWEIETVTEKTLPDFMVRNKEVYGTLVFIAMNVVDYEYLSINTAEFLRYIKQLIAVIEYYESRVKEPLVEIINE